MGSFGTFTRGAASGRAVLLRPGEAASGRPRGRERSWTEGNPLWRTKIGWIKLDCLEIKLWDRSSVRPVKGG